MIQQTHVILWRAWPTTCVVIGHARRLCMGVLPVPKVVSRSTLLVRRGRQVTPTSRESTRPAPRPTTGHLAYLDHTWTKHKVYQDHINK